MGLLNILTVVFIFVIASISMVFNELKHAEGIRNIEIVSLLFFIFEVLYNSVTVRSTSGKKLRTLEAILSNYLETHLIVDLLNILVLFLNLTFEAEVLIFFRLFIGAKFPQCMDRL